MIEVYDVKKVKLKYWWVFAAASVCVCWAPTQFYVILQNCSPLIVNQSNQSDGPEFKSVQSCNLVGQISQHSTDFGLQGYIKLQGFQGESVCILEMSGFMFW